MPPFSQVRFVLVETSHPGNVGAAARALKTMGFGRLVLVSPRHPNIVRKQEAIALASGALDVLDAAQVVDSVEQALAGAQLTVALTARPREFGPQRSDPRSVAAAAAAWLGTPSPDDGGREVAFVFGNERYGLPNDAVARCAQVVHIPTNPDYSSLNLAQAVQLIAWEMRSALLADAPAALPKIGFAGELASSEQVEQMYAHLEAALVAVGFLDPEQPKRLMPRLRRLFSRTQLECEEVNILRGIARRIDALAGARGED